MISIYYDPRGGPAHANVQPEAFQDGLLLAAAIGTQVGFRTGSAKLRDAAFDLVGDGLLPAKTLRVFWMSLDPVTDPIQAVAAD
jgi:hypothetical protein